MLAFGRISLNSRNTKECFLETSKGLVVRPPVSNLIRTLRRALNPVLHIHLLSVTTACASWLFESYFYTFDPWPVIISTRDISYRSTLCSRGEPRDSRYYLRTIIFEVSLSLLRIQYFIQRTL